MSFINAKISTTEIREGKTDSGVLIDGLLIKDNGLTANNAVTVNADLVIDTDTLFVNSTDNYVGIGTNTPSYLLDVNGIIESYSDTANNSRLLLSECNDSSNSPDLYIKKARGTHSSKSAIQNNDSIFNITPYGYDGISYVNTCGINYSIDGSVSTNTLPTKLTFQTGETNSKSDRMTIKPNGYIGINTSAPTEQLHVNGTVKISSTTTLENNLSVNGTIKLNDQIWPSNDGTANQVLKTDGNGQLSWTAQTGGGGGGTITALNNQTANRLVTIGDTTTELDGESNLTFDGSKLDVTGELQIDNINVNLNTISSTNTNGDINLSPNGTGCVNIDNIKWPTVDGSADQVLKTDGNGQLSWTTQTGGGGSGAITSVSNGADNRIATFSGSTTLNGESNLTFDNTSLNLNGVLSVAGNVNIDGNVTINGVLNSVTSNEIKLDDPLLLFGNSQDGSTPTSNIGFIGSRGNSTNIGFIWNEENDEFRTIYTSDSATNNSATISTSNGNNGYAKFHTGSQIIEDTLSVGNSITFNNESKLISNNCVNSIINNRKLLGTASSSGSSMTTGLFTISLNNLTYNSVIGNSGGLKIQLIISDIDSKTTKFEEHYIQFSYRYDSSNIEHFISTCLIAFESNSNNNITITDTTLSNGSMTGGFGMMNRNIPVNVNMTPTYTGSNPTFYAYYTINFTGSEGITISL